MLIKKASGKRRKAPNTKRTGELAEAAFVVKAAGLGLAVAKPWGDSERYDFIVDAGWRTFRVQVKCTQSVNNGGYQVQSTYCDGSKKAHYTPEDIDIFVGYILSLDLWYVVPVEALPSSASLRFYPEGNLSGRTRFEQYREAWGVFREGVPAQVSGQRTGANLGQGAVRRPLSAFRKGEFPPKPKAGVNGAASIEEVIEEEATEAVEEAPASVEPTREELPMEKMMNQWARRVQALYGKK